MIWEENVIWKRSVQVGDFVRGSGRGATTCYVSLLVGSIRGGVASDLALSGWLPEQGEFQVDVFGCKVR